MTIARNDLFDWLDEFYMTANTSDKTYGQWADSLLSLDAPEFTEQERKLLRECVLTRAGKLHRKSTELQTALLGLAEKLAPAPAAKPESLPVATGRIYPKITLLEDEEA